MLIAVVCAIAAGSFFAAGGVLQQRVASTRPQTEALSVRLLTALVAHPMWLAGIALAFLAYVLQALALAFGPLILVQPLIVTELLSALPISMRLDGLRMGRREWAGAIVVTAGLAVGLVSAAPGPGIALPGLAAWLPALAGTAVPAALAVAVARRVRGPARASLYAAAAGIAMGVQAALLNSVIALFKRGPAAGFGSWEVWAMTATALAGLLLIQTAFQAGPLAASMPVVDAVNPAVSIGLGVGIFAETVRTGPWLAGIAAGLILLFAGIVLLDTSALVQRQHRVEHGAQQAQPPDHPRSGPPYRPGA